MTNTDPFEDPGTGGDRINWNDTKGHLLLFTVHSVERGIETSFGEADAVKVDVADLDTDTTYHDTLVFPRILQSQLNGKVGGMVLGRLEQGEAKKGQSPPWRLADPTETDKVKAREHLAKAADLEEPF